ncbi:MAG: head decoration protein, partial [Methyloversatilis sp.]|nr:head decoration protein [Methyloversatilis sp.]
MTVLTEGRHPAEYILSEANGYRSREVGTLLTGNKLVSGTVLGRITVGGKLT